MLRAVQAVLADGMARPILVGRPGVIASRIERAGLRLKPGVDFEVVNPEEDSRFRACWEAYHRIMKATASRSRPPRRRCAARPR